MQFYLNGAEATLTDFARDDLARGLLQKSVESRLSTALFVSEDFKLEKTITR